MSLNETPSANRIHIGFYGKRNSGKSSLINAFTGQHAENMLFSDLPMGEEKYYIYTNASNMDLTAGNLDSFEGKNIGVFKDNICLLYTSTQPGNQCKA